jgi:SAM-dependent methyltransferase
MAEMTAGQDSQPSFRPFLRRLRGQLRRLIGSPAAVPVGAVRWGELRRTTPISQRYGFDRGTPVDRHYIEDFLSTWSADIKGHVLEVKNSDYTKAFGGSRVSKSDVLDVDAANPQATIIADLNAANELPGDAFDCIIFTQTLQYIYRLDCALRDLHRSLKPGGVLLMTVPGIAPSSPRENRYWCFTDLSVQRLLGEQFQATNIQVFTYGSLLSATAFLYGLSAEELRPNELAARDAEYQLIIAARATKALQ